MQTNLVHRKTGTLLSLEDAWFEPNGILFVENWWLCECETVNKSTDHNCSSCSVSKDGMPDALFEDMRPILGKHYECDVDALKTSGDFIVLNKTMPEILKTAQVCGVKSSPVGSESWDVKVFYDLKELSGSWLGIHYNLTLSDGGVVDEYEGELTQWPNQDIAGALNYLLGVKLPVADS